MIEKKKRVCGGENSTHVAISFLMRVGATDVKCRQK